MIFSSSAVCAAREFLYLNLKSVGPMKQQEFDAVSIVLLILSVLYF